MEDERIQTRWFRKKDLRTALRSNKIVDGKTMIAFLYWTAFLEKSQLITDGSCLGNPGKGGWAAILRYGDQEKELWGSAPHTPTTAWSSRPQSKAFAC